MNVRTTNQPAAEPLSALPARVRLLHELDRDGASAEFLRQYFLLRRELSPADLRTVAAAAERHLASWRAVS